MEAEKASEVLIKTVLKDYEGSLRYCDNRYANYQKSYLCEKESLQSFVFPKLHYDSQGMGSRTKKDLGDVYLAFQKQRKAFQEELIAAMQRVAEQRELIHRIWLCFQGLPKDEYDILHALYVENIPYKAVEKKSNVSHRTFEKNRSSAIKRIQDVCNSELPTSSLFCYAEQEGERRRNEKEVQPYEQMNLSEFLSGEKTQ
ncbi:hypothetical protein [Faecalimonas umbilicata]|uniref:hypothetical protein n=1 Tax=Faecalimonas umbilicata TaxID=1912855 RepID=UPI0022DF931A|nr:hypothetical protein [Faecalimonas umbilicata]